MDQRIVKTSKFLSLVLRHRPDRAGVELDSEGWVEIDRLIEGANRKGAKLTLESLHAAVAENDKQRFALSEDGLRIRANQGHSLRAVDLRLEARQPPEMLFHGTVEEFLPSIRKQGLLKRSRNHVHLSADRETAEKVGSRRGRAVILEVAAGEMAAAGIEFFLSANGVWLTEAVAPRYLRFPDA